VNRLFGFDSLLKAVELLAENRLVEGSYSLLGPASNLGLELGPGKVSSEGLPNNDFCGLLNKFFCSEVLELFPKRLV